MEDDVIITNRQIDQNEETQRTLNFYQTKNQVDDDNISSDGSNQAMGRTIKNNLQTTPPDEEQQIQQVHFDQENPYTDEKKFKM